MWAFACRSAEQVDWIGHPQHAAKRSHELYFVRTRDRVGSSTEPSCRGEGVAIQELEDRSSEDVGHGGPEHFRKGSVRVTDCALAVDAPDPFLREFDNESILLLALA